MEHVPVELNTIAYIMTRWMRGWRNPTSAILRIVRLQKDTGESMVATDPDSQSDCPSQAEIRAVQRTAGRRNENFQSDDNGLLRTKSKV